MKLLISTLLAVCCLTGSAFADPEVPKIIIDGIKTYQNSGIPGAFVVWVKGSAAENDAGAAAHVADLFTGIERSYGKMTGCEPIKTIFIAPSVRRVFMLLQFEKGPVYASFDCYNTQGAWIISSMDFNTKADMILPRSILGGY